MNMNQETAISKAVAGFIEDGLLPTLGGCLILLCLAVFFGAWLGGCYIMNQHDLDMEKVRNISPVTSTTKEK